MKIAGYFVPKVDQRNRPVDYPVMRAFCSMVIKKPIPKEVQDVRIATEESANIAITV